MVRLSALVCARDGEADLAACLRSLSFCDEIVVVLERGAERAREAARRAGAQVVDGIFPLPSQARAAGAELCSGDWILEVEPDEQIDRALAWEIRAALQMRPEGDWFELPVDNYVGETRVRHGWTGAISIDQAVRLSRRGVKSWRPGRVENAVLAGRSAGALTGAIRRLVGRDVGQLVERLQRESDRLALDLADADQAGSLARALLGGLGAMASSYLLRAGWREGRLGLLVALLSALHPVLVQMRAAELAAAGRAAAAEPAPLRRAAAAG
ncbi:glycosyltransferase family 2 protein [Phenylobacterium sp.]|uniref:glycosyltransferase family 2 protein n=1 Tax=Phenylobacterium sp. TaxID=1871053 RepID=UPI002810F929|nr:glycosyltransferase family 2 protein [Phenylobacterium sp.]